MPVFTKIPGYGRKFPIHKKNKAFEPAIYCKQFDFLQTSAANSTALTYLCPRIYACGA